MFIQHSSEEDLLNKLGEINYNKEGKTTFTWKDKSYTGKAYLTVGNKVLKVQESKVWLSIAMNHKFKIFEIIDGKKVIHEILDANDFIEYMTENNLAILKAIQ